MVQIGVLRSSATRFSKSLSLFQYHYHHLRRTIPASSLSNNIKSKYDTSYHYKNNKKMYLSTAQANNNDNNNHNYGACSKTDSLNDNNNEMPSATTTTTTTLSSFQPIEFVNTTAKGFGQVIFLNSPLSGGIILGGLAVSSPYLASMALTGTIVSTAVAQISGLDKDTLESGLYGYNGCLIGCAAAVFGPTAVASCATTTILGAAATPFVGAALKDAMGTVPQWTFGFNIVALTLLLQTRPLLLTPPSSSPLPIDDGSTATAAASTTIEATIPFIDNIELLTSPLTGISQIFVVESPLSGAIILTGIALYSKGLAGHALLGSIIGCTLGGVIITDDFSEIAMGLWGYNAALTSMGVGVFFRHSTPTVILSAGGAAATTTMFGAMKTMFLTTFGVPCLTLPFCVTMTACYLLRDNKVPGLTLANNPHSPEQNE